MCFTNTQEFFIACLDEPWEGGKVTDTQLQCQQLGKLRQEELEFEVIQGCIKSCLQKVNEWTSTKHVIWEGVVVLSDRGLASEPVTSSPSTSPVSTHIFISWFLWEGIYTELKGMEDGRDDAQKTEPSTFVTSDVNQQPRYHFCHGGQGRSHLWSGSLGILTDILLWVVLEIKHRKKKNRIYSTHQVTGCMNKQLTTSQAVLCPGNCQWHHFAGERLDFQEFALLRRFKLQFLWFC